MPRAVILSAVFDDAPVRQAQVPTDGEHTAWLA